jgi:hypothetical protein
VGFK